MFHERLLSSEEHETVFHHEMVKIGSQMELQMFGTSSRNSLSFSRIQKCWTKYASGVVHQKWLWAKRSAVFWKHEATKLLVKARQTMKSRMKQNKNPLGKILNQTLPLIVHVSSNIKTRSKVNVICRRINWIIAIARLCRANYLSNNFSLSIY